MPFGNGSIIGSIASGSAMTALNSLSSVIGTMGNFNAATYKSWISGNMTNFMGTVRAWCRGQVVDLDTTNFNILKNMANPAAFSGCSGTFATDSWVPSNNQNSSYPTIPCQSSTGLTGDLTTCTNTLANNGANTCAGCYDSTMLNTLIGTGSISGALTGRYGGCTFVGEMTNVWTTYYEAKRTILGTTDTLATGSGVLHRAEVANDKILNATVGSGGVFEAIDAIGTLFGNINTAMASINAMIDPTYGLVAGLNCLVFG